MEVTWLLLAFCIGFVFLLGGVAVVLLVVLGTNRSSKHPREDRREEEVRGNDTAVRGEAPTTSLKVCPRCQAELPEDAPEGLCPQCLLVGAIDSAHPSEEVAGEQTEAYVGQGTAPSVEELAGHFPRLEVLELLGQGGMGAVYKARQPSLDRLVALKVLPLEAGRDPAFAERFQREARALARLSHPNIVAVHDVGQEGELYYFVMEYVDGVNLRQLMRGGLLRPEQALRIIPQICDALEYAHGEGIVHRDIKPENILLDRKGRVKIADFGLAKLVGGERGNLTLTGTQQVMGTLYYMAPEQMERPLAVDHRADIYSLGVVFYEMLTGELPVGRFALPSEKAGVPADLDSVVLRALEKEPERRYQRASDVKTDLDGIGSGPGVQGRPAERDTRPMPPKEAIKARVRPAATALLITGILYLAILPLFCLAGLLAPTADRVNPRRPRPVSASPAAPLPLAMVSANTPAPAFPPLFAVVGVGLFEILILLFGGLVSGPLIILGASNMLNLRSRSLAVTGAILAMIPCTPCFIIGLPVGIWALVVLMDPEVREAFAS
jgi:predicted Ser/Thr protein kinase